MNSLDIYLSGQCGLSVIEGQLSSKTKATFMLQQNWDDICKSFLFYNYLSKQFVSNLGLSFIFLSPSAQGHWNTTQYNIYSLKWAVINHSEFRDTQHTLTDWWFSFAFTRLCDLPVETIRLSLSQSMVAGGEALTTQRIL